MEAFAQYGYVPLEPPAVELAEGAVAVARAAGLSADRIAALERGFRYRSTDLADARAGAPAASLRALDTLDTLGPLLEAAGVGGAIRFDLGLIPALPYYTGVVFQ